MSLMKKMMKCRLKTLPRRKPHITLAALEKELSTSIFGVLQLKIRHKQFQIISAAKNALQLN